MKLPLPSRVRILYLILAVLVAVAVVPLYFYARKVVDMNQEALERNEKLLQNTVTSSLAQDVAQRQKDILSTLASLTYSVQVSSGGNLSGTAVEAPELRALLQNYIENPDSIVPYARLLILKAISCQWAHWRRMLSSKKSSSTDWQQPATVVPIPVKRSPSDQVVTLAPSLS